MAQAVRNKSTSIPFFYQNVRGLKTKLQRFRNNLALLEHELVAITETFLDGSVEDSELACADWNILRRDRNTPCGGVLLAARPPIVLRRRQDLETDCGEDLWASFSLCGRSYYVCVFYIKPSATDQDYMQWFCKIESFVNGLKGAVIIMGDLNLNSASLNIHNYYCYFLSFCNLVDKNVVVNVYGRMLDVVLVRESDELREALVTGTKCIVPMDAHHPALDIELRIDLTRYSDQIEPSNINPALDWNFKKCDYERLYSLLSNVSWEHVLLSDDIVTATNEFYSTIYAIFDTCMPKKRRKKTVTMRYPVWFTPDIIQDIRIKIKLHSNWKRTRSEQAYQLFSEVRASLKSRAASAYCAYTRRIENNIALNPREFWRHITSLRAKGGFEPNVTFKGESCSGVAAAEAFANFFESVFLPDVPILSAQTINSSDNSCNSNYINIFKFTPNDVVCGINKLKPSGSIGPDGVPPVIFKRVKKHFVSPLCHIFNLALRTGMYPPQWKVSRVTPIPKTSNKSAVEDYRPIAILSSPAKIFENILHKLIYLQVEKYLSNAQHGFRAKRSVDTNLLTLVEYVSTHLDKGQQVDVLYFDFRRAFDRVNNDILLAKLNALGCTPDLLQLLADYLRDRQQYVRLGIYESLPYHTRSGVSQGSVLGPLLFLLMVNDLPDVLRHVKVLLYADDLKLYTAIQSISDCLALQQDIDAVYQWSIQNKMEFNPIKCSVMTFGRMWYPISFDYSINGSAITRSIVMKDLGVTFDQRLTFHDHIAVVAKESFRRLGFVLRNARDFQSEHVIRLLFSALVRSKLESSSCVWSPHEVTYALLIEKVQKAFLRYLYKRIAGYYPFMYPTKFLLGHLGYNSLETRRACGQLTTIFKILRNVIDAPDLHNELVRLHVPNHYVRSRRHRLLAVPLSRTVARANSPLPRTLTALNELLAANPDFDMFVDEWKDLMLVCLRHCENGDV